MASLNLMSGRVRVRDQRRPILWTGENAKHLMKSLIMEKAKKQKGIGSVEANDEGFIQKSVQELQEYGGFNSEQETVEFVNKSLKQISRHRQKVANRSVTV